MEWAKKGMKGTGGEPVKEASGTVAWWKGLAEKWDFGASLGYTARCSFKRDIFE